MKITSALALLLANFYLALPYSAVAKEEAEFPNEIMEESIEQLNVWTEQFLGLPEGEAITLLKEYFGDGVNYSYEHRVIGLFEVKPVKAIRVTEGFQNGYLVLTFHPETKKIREIKLKVVKPQPDKESVGVKSIPTSLKQPLLNLGEWSQQFVGLSKKDAIDILKDYPIKKLKLKDDDPVDKLTLVVVISVYHTYLLLPIDPIDNKVTDTSYTVRLVNRLEIE